MKNRYFITVTDLKGMKSYSFDKIIKTYVLALLVALFISLGTISVVALILNNKVKEYSYYQVENEKLKINIKNSAEEYALSLEAANKDISAKTLELENIEQKIDEIEKLMGDDKVLDDNLAGVAKLDVAKINIRERLHMLNTIPSGSPVEPFKGYTSKYGSRYHPVLKRQDFHKGLDFKAPVGTTLLASADGVVEFAGWNSGGFGNLVIISHAYGFKTYYAHMDKISVKVGEILRRGEKIGTSGKTGRVSGPHLHYEVLYLGKRVDPMSFTEWRLDNYEYLFKNEKGINWKELVDMIKDQTEVFQEPIPAK